MSEQRYTYLWRELVGLKDYNTEQELNALASQGWRLISFDQARRTAVFERPVQLSDRTVTEPGGPSDV